MSLKHMHKNTNTHISMHYIHITSFIFINMTRSCCQFFSLHLPDILHRCWTRVGGRTFGHNGQCDAQYRPTDGPWRVQLLRLDMWRASHPHHHLGERPSVPQCANRTVTQNRNQLLHRQLGCGRPPSGGAGPSALRLLWGKIVIQKELHYITFNALTISVDQLGFSALLKGNIMIHGLFISEFVYTP